MAIEDIGFLLFHQILGMTEYPGSPFTGNIINDLIMFLLVPSTFIIMMLYMMVGRFFASAANPRMRMLIGITAYLFIIAGGYYSIFARIAGPYFFLLILVMGLLYFLLGHIGIGRAGGGGAMPGGAVASTSSTHAHYEDMSMTQLRNLKEDKERLLKQINKHINQAISSKEQSRLEELRLTAARLSTEIEEIKIMMNPASRARRKMPFG